MFNDIFKIFVIKRMQTKIIILFFCICFILFCVNNDLNIIFPSVKLSALAHSVLFPFHPYDNLRLQAVDPFKPLN